MTALFRNNQIYRNDVKGNAQTIYFMQEDESPQVTGLLVLESGDLTFFIEEKQVVKITYRNNPVWTIYPMDKIPPRRGSLLEGVQMGGQAPAHAARCLRPHDPAFDPCGQEQPATPAVPRSRRASTPSKRRLIESRRWS